VTDEVNRLAALLEERLLASGGSVAPAEGAAPAGALGAGAGAGAGADAGPDGGVPEVLATATDAERPGDGEGTAAPGPAAAPRSFAPPPGGTLAGALEAVLLVANEPMSAGELMKVLEGASRAEVNQALRELRERYASRPGGFDIVDIAGGVRLLTRPEYAPWVERLERVRREERLSRAQLEVLAVIAYRQPILRADIDSVRGADSGAALRGLADRGLVKVVGRADQLGRPLLYGTTERFLERFTLKSLKDLPRPRAEN
jgi:segregation and condensation protein B